MSEILLRADETRDLAAEMSQASTDATDRFESMRGRLNSLTDSFRGQAATAFDSRYEEWDQGARQVVDALQSLSEWLNQAAETLENVDTELGGSLG